jgi:hypothetical protein
MRSTVFFPLALTAFAWVSLAAQQGGSSAPAGSPPAVQVPTTGSATDTTTPGTGELKPVKTELVSTLDTKTAKTGDKVIVKTTQTIKTADGTEIPKGSKLLGQVAQVRPHSDASQNSAVAVNFDQAELKNGQTLPIHSLIQSVDPPEGSQSGADTMASTAAGPTSGGAAASGGARTPTGATGGSAPSASGAPTPGATSTPGTSQNASVAGRVVAGAGPNAIRTTDIPNIYLASDAALPVSGVLYSAKTDVHLDGGTQLVLGIAATGSH